MLDKVKEYALVKFAGDEKAQAEFVEGFEKEASNFGFQELLGKERKKDSIADRMGLSVSEAMGKGIGGIAVSLGTMGVGSAYKHVVNLATHSKFLQALEFAVRHNRNLQNEDRAKILQYAETIFKFAPNVSTDPNILTSTLVNAVLGDGMDIQTIKTLTELEAKYTDNNAFSVKEYK